MQTLRPTSTVSAGGWTANTGTIHDALSIESAAAWINTSAGAVTTCRVKLANGDTPASGTRTLRYGVSRLATNRAVTIEVRLYQGTTLLETSTYVNPGTAHPDMTAGTLDVTASITDYTDLYAEIAVTSAHAAGVGYGYYIALDIPDAAGATHESSFAAEAPATVLSVSTVAGVPSFDVQFTAQAPSTVLVISVVHSAPQPPGPITDLEAVAVGSYVDLTWTPPPNATTQRVERRISSP
jgi:hypothetical protein